MRRISCRSKKTESSPLRNHRSREHLRSIVKVQRIPSRLGLARPPFDFWVRSGGCGENALSANRRMIYRNEAAILLDTGRPSQAIAPWLTFRGKERLFSRPRPSEAIDLIGNLRRARFNVNPYRILLFFFGSMCVLNVHG